MVNARSLVDTDVQIMTVQKDGITRNGENWNYGKLALKAGNRVNICMFLEKENCTLPDNECGVPHSMLDPDDQAQNAPYYLYWEQFLVQKSVEWFSGTIDDIGMPPTSPVLISECTKLPLVSPPAKIVANSPPEAVLILDSSIGLVNVETILKELSQVANYPRFFMHLIPLNMSSDRTSSFVLQMELSGLYEIQKQFDSYTIIELDGIKVLNFSIDLPEIN